jgi:hypothetical protein
MFKKLTSLLFNGLTAIRFPKFGAAAANTMPASSPMLDGLSTALGPKIAEELRHRPDGGVLDMAAAQTAHATTDMLLDAHIAELKTALEAQRREAQHLRQIATASELGIRVRNLLAEHRGGN